MIFTAGWPLRIGSRAYFVIIFTKPVSAPLPYVAGHVVQAIAVRRKCANRRASYEAVGSQVMRRKNALPAIRQILAFRIQLIAPGIFFPGEPAALGIFKLGFGRQTLARPLRISRRIIPGNLRDRLVE